MTIQEMGRLKTGAYQKMLAQCIHCGLCLNVCPTYSVFGTEMQGPRGRIVLMRAAAEGQISPLDFREVFSRHLMLCLACRACETACPSGVKYGSLVETARFVIEKNRRPGWGERLLRWFGTRQLMPKMGLLKVAAYLMWLYEKLGFQKVVRSFGFLPKALQAMEDILPPIRLDFTRHNRPEPAKGQLRGRVLFFTGCIQEAFLASVNAATIRVLQRNGYEVVAPVRQTCCGAAVLHLGDEPAAVKMARQNIDAFMELEPKGGTDDFEAIICNAGGCGAVLKEYAHLLHEDPTYAERAIRFSEKVKDVTEFLADHLHVLPEFEIRVRATYSDSCHLRHAQRVISQPRALLNKIPGLELVELTQPDRCCGSAGVYNIAQVDTANEILAAKMDDIAATGAEIVVTTNTGCHMQLIAGVRKTGLKARVMHLVELLDLAYCGMDTDEDAKAARDCAQFFREMNRSARW